MRIITAKDNKSCNELDSSIQRGNIIVLIYADWCGHCQTFKPEWEKFKTLMKKRNVGCDIGEVEQTHLDKVESASANGFPTIKFYTPNNSTATFANNTENYNSNTKYKLKELVPLAGVPTKHNPFLHNKEAVAERSLVAEDVVLSNMDSPETSNNDANANHNNEVPYEGPRNTDNLLKFVEENSNNANNNSNVTQNLQHTKTKKPKKPTTKKPTKKPKKPTTKKLTKKTSKTAKPRVNSNNTNASNTNASNIAVMEELRNSLGKKF